jgi:hypothetical protein
MVNTHDLKLARMRPMKTFTRYKFNLSEHECCVHDFYIVVETEQLWSATT